MEKYAHLISTIKDILDELEDRIAHTESICKFFSVLEKSPQKLAGQQLALDSIVTQLEKIQIVFEFIESTQIIFKNMEDYVKDLAEAKEEKEDEDETNKDRNENEPNLGDEPPADLPRPDWAVTQFFSQLLNCCSQCFKTPWCVLEMSK